MARPHLLFACAWLLAVAGVAGAQAVDAEGRAQAHYQLGRTAFEAHDYDRAIKEFETGYRNKPSPVFLYNIARAADLAGQSQKALDHYRLYLQMAPKAPERAEVTQRIAELEQSVGPSAPRRVVKKDHHTLVIALSVVGAVLVVGAAAVGAAVGEQSQSGYASWGTLAVTPH